MPDSPDTCGRGLSRSDQKSILLECKINIHLARKYQLITLFLRRPLHMWLPFYVVIRATRRSSGPMQGKGSTFISHRTRPLSLQSSTLQTGRVVSELKHTGDGDLNESGKLLKRFNLNGHITGFGPHKQMLSLWLTIGIRKFKCFPITLI